MVIPEDPPEVNLGTRRRRSENPQTFTGWQQLVMRFLGEGQTLVKFSHEGRALIGFPGNGLRPQSRLGNEVTIAMQTVNALVDRGVLEEKERSHLFIRYGLVGVADENPRSERRRGGDDGPGGGATSHQDLDASRGLI